MSVQGCTLPLPLPYYCLTTAISVIKLFAIKLLPFNLVTILPQKSLIVNISIKTGKVSININVFEIQQAELSRISQEVKGFLS